MGLDRFRRRGTSRDTSPFSERMLHYQIIRWERFIRRPLKYYRFKPSGVVRRKLRLSARRCHAGAIDGHGQESIHQHEGQGR